MSPVPSPPACGPAAVAIVPAASVIAPSTTSPRTAQTLTRSCARRVVPGSCAARQTRTTQATSSSIESRKCPITQPGLSPYQTVMPPSTAWQRTPSGSSSAISARSRRNGRRNQARIAAARQGRPTTPVSSRLPNSMNACVESSGVSRVPWQRGQSGQPSPEPVRRTAAPVKTISVHTTSAETATQKYARGVSVKPRSKIRFRRATMRPSVDATRRPLWQRASGAEATQD